MGIALSTYGILENAKKLLLPMRDDVVRIHMNSRIFDKLVDANPQCYMRDVQTLFGIPVEINNALGDNFYLTERRDGTFCYHAPE